jgi:hypothetical protein
VSVPKQLPPGVTLLALPFVSKQGFDPATVSSLIFALIYNGLGKCLFNFYGDYPVSHARNAAASDAILKGAEWLFFVDSDMDFPVNTLERLKALDADIACTDMWSRNWPSFRTVLEYDKTKRWPKKKELVPVAGGQKIKGARDVDCTGMACTLVKVSLLRKFAKAKLMPFIMTEHGEDAGFCMVAKQKFKAKIRCDFDVVSGHWGRNRMVGQDFTRDARNQYGAVADPEMLKRMGARNIDEVLAERKVD